MSVANYDLPDELSLTAEGPIRILTLNRPDQLNAVNHTLHHALGRVWLQMQEDEEARAVVITGAGKAFSAGGDFEMMRRLTTDSPYRHATLLDARRIATEMIDFPLPVVAAVNGAAVGLGCSLAVLSDVVLMSDRAFFSDPHVSIGLVAADGGALAWPSFMSLLKAKEYLLTGEKIPAQTAVELGLANRVVSHDDLMDEARALALRLAERPWRAVRDTKRALNAHLSRSVRGVIDFAFAAESETFTSDEFAATIEKFTPTP
jgi:enoyl-CoA hydratase